MIRVAFTTFCGLLSFFAVACTALGVDSPTSCRQGVAVTIASISTARDTSTAALVAGKISVADKENLEQQADAAREGAEVARGLCDSAPAAAASRLDLAKAVLTGINQYLLVAQGGK